MVDIDALRPHPRNARNGDVDAIAESLRVNGQYKPITIAADGTILAGNHTYMAAMSIGWDVIAAIRLDIGPDTPEALRIMLVDNRSADLGNYDRGLLADNLTNLNLDVGLIGTGYTDDDLIRLLHDINDPIPDPEPDEPPGSGGMICPQCGYHIGQ